MLNQVKMVLAQLEIKKLMAMENLFMRLARMGESLSSEGHIYVGFTCSCGVGKWMFRHPNGRRLMIESDGKSVCLRDGNKILKKFDDGNSVSNHPVT